jgi:hypothetical protein
MSLKNIITNLYGEKRGKIVDRLARLREKRTTLGCRLKFLVSCRDLDVVPSWIKIKHHLRDKHTDLIFDRASKALLRKTIQDTRKDLWVCNEQLYFCRMKVCDFISLELWDRFDFITTNHNNWLHQTTSEKLNRKLENLCRKQHRYRGTRGTFTTPKTVYNLSNICVSEAGNRVLARGFNFAIAPKSIPVEPIIAGIEDAVKRLPFKLADVIRQDVAYILRKGKEVEFKENVKPGEMEALRDLRNNKEVVILKADKGNATVIMNTVDYKRQMDQVIQSDDYVRLNKDPTSKFEKRLTDCLDKAPIEAKLKKELVPKESVIPKAYGLPKIHKIDWEKQRDSAEEIKVPMRLVISAIGAPAHEIARSIGRVLREPVVKAKSFVKNSQDFLMKIKQVNLEEGDMLVSLDVVGLFSNVPLNETIEILKRNRRKFRLPLTLINLIEECLNCNYFLWDGQIY